MNRPNLTASQNAHRHALMRLKSALAPLRLGCTCDLCIEEIEPRHAAATLREVARLCMAEAARLDEEKGR